MLRFLVFLFGFGLVAPLFGQATQTQFGKNRVQYHQEFAEWLTYESPNFITYWYGESRNIGQTAVLIAEQEYFNIQNLLEYHLNEKIDIIVYKDLTDLKMSNIGSEDAFENSGSLTKIVGTKMFVYYTGDYNDMRRQIREGIASIYLNAMLFGSNLQEIVQNAVLLNLPSWFKDGLISYAGETWNQELDNELRLLFQSGEYDNFEDLLEDHPNIGGHAFWHFISTNYGKSNVSSLLYLTRVNRSIESGFLYVLGNSYYRVTNSIWEYYSGRYQLETQNGQTPSGKLVPIKNKRDLPISNLALSPNGQQLAYVLNEQGKRKIYLYDLQTDKRERIFKQGFRNTIQATDYNYPLLAWSPSGMELSIIHENRDVLKLTRYDVETGKKVDEELPNQYQRIYSLDYITNGQLLFTAAIRGVADVFTYFLNTRQSQRITNDFWDDRDAVYVNLLGKPGIVFASNRTDSLLEQRLRVDSILPTGKFDLFYHDLANKSGELTPLTRTPFADERHPMAVDTTYFSYLSDVSGINNRYVGQLDSFVHHLERTVIMKDGFEFTMHADSSLSANLDSLEILEVDSTFEFPVYRLRGVTHPSTNWAQSAVNQVAARRTSRVATVFEGAEQPQVYLGTVHPDTVVVPFETAFLSNLRTRAANPEKPKKPRSSVRVITAQPAPKKEAPPADKPLYEPVTPPVDTGKIDIDSYLFQSEFDDEEVPISDPKKKQEVTQETLEESGLTPQTPEEILRQMVQPVPEPTDRLHDFKTAQITPYRLTFRTDYVTTTVDNNLLFDGLNTFAGTPQDFAYPLPGILLKGNAKDLFEDYEIEGGVRVPLSFNGTEYFLWVQNRKKRLDKKYAFYRRSLRFNEEPPLKIENNITVGQVQFSYPLDIFRSFRLTGTFRMDKNFALSTDLPFLNSEEITEQRIGARLEYIFDNTLDVALNIKNGTRYKVFAEAVKRMDINIATDPGISLNDGFMGVLGFDFRHYQRFLKHSVLAFRATGATSFGREKILYLLGGTDGWIIPQVNEEIPRPTTGDFAFQGFANNMRGFRLNIRNGNSFALANAELRVPVVRYFSNSVKSAFFRNLQLVGFFDAGTAWLGSSPFSDENPLNTVDLPSPPNPNNPVTARVTYFRDPIVAGYGFGARTTLLGYFIRVDRAWGVETREVQDPRWFISLGLDF